MSSTKSENRKKGGELACPERGEGRITSGRRKSIDIIADRALKGDDCGKG